MELELFATTTVNAELTPSCLDETNGSIALNITEGDGPFIFDWSDQINADTLRENLSPGLYTLTLTDANGCSSLHAYDCLLYTSDAADE